MLTGCSSGSGSGTSATATATTTSTATSTAPSRPAASSSQQPSSSTSSAATKSSSTSSPPLSLSPAVEQSGRCTTSALRASIVGSSAAAGSNYYRIALRNSSSATCTLNGYPGVSLVAGSSGRQVGAAAARDTAQTPIGVRVSAGKSATFELRVAVAQNYPADRCQPVPTRGLRIYPPGNKRALYLPVPGVTGCAKASVNLLSVQAIGTAR
ncbi:DUF4232 domain-containing protein [Dermatophilaceae bacterium Sec6.4]